MEVINIQPLTRISFGYVSFSACDKKGTVIRQTEKTLYVHMDGNIGITRVSKSGTRGYVFKKILGIADEMPLIWGKDSLIYKLSVGQIVATFDSRTNNFKPATITNIDLIKGGFTAKEGGYRIEFPFDGVLLPTAKWSNARIKAMLLDDPTYIAWRKQNRHNLLLAKATEKINKMSVEELAEFCGEGLENV